MSFFAELKRRKVVRVAVVYGAVAWLLIQVAATIAPMMNLSAAAPRLVLFLLIVLFPVALLLAWAYELTPDRGHVAPGESAEALGRSAGSNLAVAAVVIVVALAGLGLYFYNRPADPAADATAAASASQRATAEKSIAVLPFTAFSSSADDQFFADGLSDTLLDKLAALKDIKVISRASSFQYRGDAVDVREVGKNLQVATVLEGSVQRSGDRLRIIAQLIDTTTGGHIWSQTFDRQGADIFAIHDEIAANVVDKLELSLSPEEQQRLQASGTESPEAYALLTYISERAQAAPLFETSTEAYKKEQYGWIDETKRVLKIDPDYADAYRFIADRYNALLFQATNTSDRDYHLRKGFEALDQAMLLEPTNPKNFALFAALTRRSGDTQKAEAFARLAYAGLPNDPGSIAELSLALLAQNKNPAEVLTLVGLEEAVNPTSSTLYRRKMRALEGLGRFEDAARLVESQLDRTDEPQLAALDIVEVASLGLGQQLRAAQTLIDVRRKLDDDVGDVLLGGWMNLAAWLGLTEQVERLMPRLESADSKAVAAAVVLGQHGNLQEANRQLRAYADAAPARLVRVSVADQCLLLRDYDCAVHYTLAAWPELESREGREPTIDGPATFESAIRLSKSLRELGDANAADRLLNAASTWHEARAKGGYVFSEHYYVTELYSLLDDQERAVEEMRKQVMRDGEDFVPDCAFCSFESPTYDSIRGNPEFQRLVAEYGRRKTAAAAAVRRAIADAGY